MGKKQAVTKTVEVDRNEAEAGALLESLRAHGRVVDSVDPICPLGPGQTHVLVKKPGEARGQLIERRKSLFRR